MPWLVCKCTITTLSSPRFTSSLDAAEALKGTRQYIQAARSMGAVMQLSRYFDQYKAIEPVRFSLASHADRCSSAARADVA